MADKKYFVKRVPEWSEVSEEEFRAAAEEAGYGREAGQELPVAFSNGTVMGRTSLNVRLKRDAEEGASDEQAH